MKNIFVLFFTVFLTVTVVTAQIPNAGFEDWDSLSIVNGQRIYNPADWSGYNADMVSQGKEQPVRMTTDAHSGKYAVHITSANQDNQPMGILFSGHNTQSGMDEKFRLAGKVKSFSGYYKYDPKQGSAVLIRLVFYKSGAYTTSAEFMNMQPKSAYTKFVYHVDYPSHLAEPDSALFIIQASHNSTEGSVLIVDDLSIQYSNVGTDEIESASRITIYPNPADDLVTFENMRMKNTSYKISDITGKIIKEGMMEADTLTIDELLTGIYCIQIQNENNLNQYLRFIKK